VRLLFSTGEASGDAYGAALLEEIRSQAPSRGLAGDDLRVQAAGGRRLAIAGASIVADSSHWGAIGIAESLRIAPTVMSGASAIKRELASGTPGLFIPIDFGFVNIRLCKHAKRHGWKVLYFMPPGSWRREKQGEDLPSLCDEIVTPFFWSAELLRKMGANAHCFGHPVKQLVKARETELHAQGKEDRTTLAVFPGSRNAEIARHLPVIARAISDEPHSAEFAVAPNFSSEALRALWKRLAPSRTSDVFTENDPYGVLLRARAAIVCSGTATLEAALCVCPHVVLYKVGRLVELQARIAGLAGKLIAQPNILLGRELVPELVQHKATAESLRMRLQSLMQESAERKNQIFGFMELNTLVGPADALTKTAELALEMMSATKTEPELTTA
jgi:lipid-A-disaccharide synthase